jgi:hypothetical protein
MPTMADFYVAFKSVLYDTSHLPVTLELLLPLLETRKGIPQARNKKQIMISVILRRICWRAES